MNIWGQAWKSYIPPARRVYGCICITPSNKVLLVQGRQGEKKWSFPKGHREPTDISPINCALRELKEETGITLNQSFLFTKRFRAGEYFIYQVPMELDTEPEDYREIQSVRWCTIGEMEQLNKNVDVSLFTQEVKRAFEEMKSTPQNLSDLPHPDTMRISDGVPTCA